MTTLKWNSIDGTGTRDFPNKAQAINWARGMFDLNDGEILELYSTGEVTFTNTGLDGDTTTIKMED